VLNAVYTPFARWVEAHGRQTLAEYLLLHPLYVARGLRQDAAQLLDPRSLAYYQAPGTSPVLPSAVGNVLYPPSKHEVELWVIVIVTAVGLLGWRRRLASGIWIVVVALVLQLPLAMAAWAADDPEMPRHALLAEMLTRLSLLILSLFVLEVLLTRGAAAIRARSGSRSPAA
jgi:hypothetical protein